MNLLPTIKSGMKWLCIYPANKSESVRQKIAYKIVGGTVVVINCAGTASHFAFMLKFWSTDLEGSLTAFMGLVANIGTIYTKLIAFLLQHRMHRIFVKLAKIFDASMCRIDFEHFAVLFCWIEHAFHSLDKNDESFKLLLHVNEVSKWITSILKTFMIFFACCTILMCIASVLICRMIHGYSDVRYFFHPSNVMYGNMIVLALFYRLYDL